MTEEKDPEGPALSLARAQSEAWTREGPGDLRPGQACGWEGVRRPLSVLGDQPALGSGPWRGLAVGGLVGATTVL